MSFEAIKIRNFSWILEGNIKYMHTIENTEKILKKEINDYTFSFYLDYWKKYGGPLLTYSGGQFVF